MSSNYIYYLYYLHYLWEMIILIKLVIEVNDLKTLMVNASTRNAALAICDGMKLSKYAYTGAEAKTGVYYYYEMKINVLKRLRDLIFNDEKLIEDLDMAFLIQIIKKILKNEVGLDD